MSSAIALLKILAQLFLLMLAGFIFRKRNVLKSDGRKLITDLVMDFLLPCSIFKSFVGALNTVNLSSMLTMILISLGISVLGIIVGLFFRIKNAEGTLDNASIAPIRYGLICSNVTFMGSPLITAVFGDAGLVLWAVYMIPYRIVMWTYGTGLFTRPKPNEILKKFILSPSIIATILGLIFMFARWSLPDFITKTLTSGGNCVTGLTMMVIGSILAESKPSEVFSKLTLSASFARLIIMPVIVLIITVVLKLEPLIIGVATCLAGMPYATTTVMFSEKYGGNAQLASYIVFVTTLFSAITVTVLMIIFGNFYPGIIIGT